jgi:hypothetical protein
MAHFSEPVASKSVGCSVQQQTTKPHVSHPLIFSPQRTSKNLCTDRVFRSSACIWPTCYKAKNNWSLYCFYRRGNLRLKKLVDNLKTSKFAWDLCRAAYVTPASSLRRLEKEPEAQTRQVLNLPKWSIDLADGHWTRLHSSCQKSSFMLEGPNQLSDWSLCPEEAWSFGMWHRVTAALSAVLDVLAFQNGLSSSKAQIISNHNMIIIWSYNKLQPFVRAASGWDLTCLEQTSANTWPNTWPNTWN